VLSCGAACAPNLKSEIKPKQAYMKPKMNQQPLNETHSTNPTPNRMHPKMKKTKNRTKTTGESIGLETSSKRFRFWKVSVK